MLSVIIPSYNEPYLQKTIDSLLTNSQGEIEIVVILDGYAPQKPVKKDKRVKIITFPKNLGMRAAINAGIAKSSGKYIMKSDAHCIFGKGFDVIMTKHSAQNWILVPRRYSLLDDKNWQRNEKRPIRDYHYLTIPMKVSGYGICMSSQDWLKRGSMRSDPKYDIDDTMTFQGSCWMADKKYFLKRVGFLDDRKESYGPFGGEQLEIGLKYWLGGDEVKVIKKTWYAHLSKQPRHYQSGEFTREYKRAFEGRTWAAKHWLNNEEPGMIHSFSWLVEKFWPVPTWPEDRNLWVFPVESKMTPDWKNNPRIQKLNFPAQTSDTLLCKLADKYKSEKYTRARKHACTKYYYQLLKDKRKKFKKVLEIGIGNSGGLHMWQDFFPNAKIYGADYDRSRMINEGRIESILCDQRRGEHLKSLIDKIGSDIDLVVEDGSDRLRYKIFTCLTLMPLLNKKVTYIIEDVADASIVERFLEYDVEIPKLYNATKHRNMFVVIRHKKS